MAVLRQRKVRGFTTYDCRTSRKSNSLPRQGALHRKARELLDASWTVREPLAGFLPLDTRVRVPTGNRVRRTAGEGIAGEGRPAPSMCFRVTPGSGSCAPREQGRLSSGNDWPRHDGCETKAPKGADAYGKDRLCGSGSVLSLLSDPSDAITHGQHNQNGSAT
jgi:hypothetical protein